MKINMFILLFMSVMTIVSSSCNNNTNNQTTEFSINGTVSGAENMKIYFDKLDPIDNLSEILAQENIDDKGDFTIGLENEVEAGIYRLRIGNMQSIFALNGEESNITLSSPLNTFNQTDYDITGAPAVSEYQAVMNEMKTGQMQLPQVIEK